MRLCFLAGIVAVGAVAMAQSARAPLQLERMVELPGISGDMDHLAIDASRGRLFVAAEDNGTLRVIDLKRGKPARTIRGFHTPHSILFLPDRQELIVTDGSNSVKVLDSDTFRVKKEIATMPGADSIVMDGPAHLLYAVSGGKDVSMTRSAIAAIDTQADALKTEIPIDAAHVEAMVLEHSGPRLFVNVTDKNYLAVVDRTKGSVIGQWPVKEAQQNAPLAFDEENHRLFIVCRQPGTLVIASSDDGQTVASFPTGARADEVVFDPTHRRIYVAAGEGKIYPYEVIDANHYNPLTPVTSATGAKTALLSPDARELYVAVSPGEGKVGAKVLMFRVN